MQRGCCDLSSWSRAPCRDKGAGRSAWSKPWVADEPRQHWVLRSHCECLLFPCHQPSPELATWLATWLWRRREVSGRHRPSYQALLASRLLDAFRSWRRRGAASPGLLLDGRLAKFSCTDSATRRRLVAAIERVLRGHLSGLEAVSLENCSLDCWEGVKLLTALVASSRHSLKELCLRGAFAPDQSPLGEDTKPARFRGSRGLAGSYVRAVGSFTALTSLWLDHSLISEGLLVCLVARTPANLRHLHILCLEHHLGRSPAVADHVWKLATDVCPQLSVNLVVVGVVQHSAVRTFIRPSMPMRSFCIASGLQLSRPEPWDFNITLRILAAWYSQSLECISIHLHRSREYLDGMLSDMFCTFTSLERLEFVGVVQDVEIINDMCILLAHGKHRAKQVRICVQESSTVDRTQLRDRLRCIDQQHREDLAAVGVGLDLSTYAA